MFELLLLISFAAAALGAGGSIIVNWKVAKDQGIEVPAALFSNKPPGEIRMHDWAQRQIEPERKLAIEIGMRELGLPEREQWEREFHVAIEATGGRKRDVIPGDYIIERSGDGRAIEHQLPDTYHLDDCTCNKCRFARRQAQSELETIDIKELDW